MRHGRLSLMDYLMHSPQSIKRVILHWPEYLMEAIGLGLFMISACVFGSLLEHPASAVNMAIENPLLRRAVMALAMGSTAIAIICSPWGQRSGAHLNPAVTLTFYTLGKVERWDALFYVLAEFCEGMAGVKAGEWIVGPAISDPAVNYVVTVPGAWGTVTAFLAEVLISAILMFTVLVVSNSKPLARWTPLFAGGLVASFILIEAPVSGMSMNPTRTFGSALFAAEWTSIWLYFTAPLIGMGAASFLYRYSHGVHRVFCAKLHHHNNARCIFRCKAGELFSQPGNRGAAPRHS